MITVDFTQHGSMARTLSPFDLGENDSGWTITGQVVEDYYEWVNYFEAVHAAYGELKGDFEHEVTAESQEAYDHFIKNHPFAVWDYYDI